MTTTDQTIDAVTTVSITKLIANADNPRSKLGDLAELTRSIKAHGVLQPLLVLPVDEHGNHTIVAGHRRRAAAANAGVEVLPVVVRALSPVECIEVALAENANRDDLDLGDEIAAIEKLMSLDDALTPAKLSKRIGKSQTWVRDRMTVTVLPVRWRAALSKGTLSLTAATAAASVADLGPEHLDAVCALLADRSWRDPKQAVEDYRRNLRRTAAYEAAVAKYERSGVALFCDANPLPASAKRLTEIGLAGDQHGAHANEPCHAMVISRGWGDKPDVSAVCTEPRRHRATRAGGEPVSAVVAEQRPSHGGGDDSHAKRQGRLARLCFGAEVFGRRRGGLSTTELTALALPVLIDMAGMDALGCAATLLGVEQTGGSPYQSLTAMANESPAALARVAGAVACGIAETRAYHSTGTTVASWFRFLTENGWEPDPWTASRAAAAVHNEADVDE